MFCSTAIGICNFSSRLLTIFSDEVAEVHAPIPMILFCSICAVAMVLAWFIKTLKMQVKVGEVKGEGEV